ncbi:major royal jelly protein 1-like [Hetaerina americana]|uniref:major royal jelly protein 1-like n=1 Tax=Hetaerina americana TaxID=62018 RepID=UPI003A7F2054
MDDAANVKKVDDFIISGRRASIQMPMNETDVSYSSVWKFIHGELHMSKMYMAHRMASTSAALAISTFQGVFFTFIYILAVAPVCVSSRYNYEVVYAWKVIDYNWPSPKDREEAVENGDYIPKNNVISGVKIWEDRVYVTVPRLVPGVPSTLNWVPWVPATEWNLYSKKEPLSTPLTPFPCMESQKPGDCYAIQNVQSMEIDPLGRMWVLDVGRRNLMTPVPDNKCSPKILILDLKNGGKQLRMHVFPEEVASRNDSFLNDLVVDVNGSPDGSDWFAYISESGGPPDRGGAIVVYDLKNDESWKVIDPSSMSFDLSASTARIGGQTAKLIFNVDGIALSPVGKEQSFVYYCPLGSLHLYSIPASVLRTVKDQNVTQYVRDLGKKRSQTDGMMMDNRGQLYYGMLTEDALARVNQRDLIRSNGKRVNEKVVLKDQRLEWIDGLGFDWTKHLWFVTNRLQNLQAKAVKTSEINYRLNRFNARAMSYMYPQH